jgi:hypothetical protein
MVSFNTKKIKKSSTTAVKRGMKRRVSKKKKTFSKYLLKILLYLVLFSTI